MLIFQEYCKITANLELTLHTVDTKKSIYKWDRSRRLIEPENTVGGDSYAESSIHNGDG